MLTRHLTLTNTTGLHARPAAQWVEAASRYQCDVRIRFADSEVDGKSILGVLSLGLGAGTTFDLVVDGADELAAARGLEDLVLSLAQQGE
jgi:phosphocarrier protein